MKVAGCSRLALSAETGDWFRAVDLKFWNIKDPLYTAHTKPIPTRYNPGSLLTPSEQFEVLYLAENPQVALFEVGALLSSPTAPVATSKTSWIHAVVHVNLQKVADLTTVAEIKKIGTTFQELTGDWEGYADRAALSSMKKPVEAAPTQQLGATLFRATDAEAFFAYSARVPTHRILVIFPEKLKINSYLRFQDPKTGKFSQLNGNVP